MGKEGCCGDGVGEIYIPEKKRTFKEKTLAELTTPWKIKADLPTLLEFLSDRFFSIKSKGGKAAWNKDAEEFVLKEVLKEGVQMFYERKLRAALAAEANSSSTEHLLVANPSQWPTIAPNIPLNHFSAESMNLLMKANYLVLKKFIDSKSMTGEALNSLLKLERESRFTRAGINERDKVLDFSLKQSKADGIEA